MGSFSNEVSAISDEIGEAVSDTKQVDINYTSIDKEAISGASDSLDRPGWKTLSWKITFNKEEIFSVNGHTLVDTLTSADHTVFSGEGITITRISADTDEKDAPKESISWDDLLTGEDDTSFRVLIQEEDPEAVYRYVIEYTTDTDPSKAVGDITVTNAVEDENSKANDTATGTIGIDGIGVEKTALSVTTEEAIWEITLQVPAAGLSTAVLEDTLPFIGYNPTYYDNDYEVVSVEGLLEGETYVVTEETQADWSSGTGINIITGVILTFFQDKDQTISGLQQAENVRNIVITLKTKLNPDWVALGEGNAGFAKHTNTVAFKGNDSTETDHADAIPPIEQKVYKEFGGIKSGASYDTYCGVLNLDSTWGATVPEGDHYQYFGEFLVAVSGIQNGVSIKDSINKNWLFYADSMNYVEKAEWGEYYTLSILGFEPRLYGCNATISEIQDTTEEWKWKIETSNFAIPSVTRDESGVITFTVPQEDIPLTADGNQFPSYVLAYSMVLDEDKAVAESIAEKGMITAVNTASFGDVSDTAKVNYSADIVEKTASVLGTKDGADFSIVINPDGLDLAEGDILTVTDTFSENMTLLYKSIEVNPSENVTYDVSGHVMTFWIPDETRVEITYRGMSYQKGTQTLTNTVSVLGYSSTASCEITKGDSGAGVSSNPAVTLFKYESENMSQGLAGAVFELLIWNEKTEQWDPIKNRDGTPASFTTGSDGLVTISGNQRTKGWVLECGTKYALKETKAPSGYQEDETFYQFTIAEDNIPNTAQYIFEDMGTVKVRNQMITEDRNRDDAVITVTKVDEEDQGKLLSGAVFTLYADENGTEEVSSYETPEAGEVMISTADNTLSAYLPRDGEVVTYYLKETTAPAGYELDDTVYVVKIGAVKSGEWNEDHTKYLIDVAYTMSINGDESLTVTNEKRTDSVTVHNEVTINKKDDNGAALVGAMFAILESDGATEITTFTAGSKTISTADDNLAEYLPAAGESVTLKVREKSAPAGYEKDTKLNDLVITATEETAYQESKDAFVTTTTYTITIDGKDALDVTNTKKTDEVLENAEVTLNKVDENEDDLTGATFAILESDGTTEITTFEAGKKIISTNEADLQSYLPAAGKSITLKVKEKSAPAGYTADPALYNLVISATAETAYDRTKDAYVTTTTYRMTINGEDSLTVTNERKTGSDRENAIITINKKDQYGTVLPGAKFTVYDGETGLLTVTTDADGKATISTAAAELSGKLPAVGATRTLTVKESEAPAGYQLNSTTYTLVITASSNEALKDDVYVTTTTYTMKIAGEDSVTVVDQKYVIDITGTKTWIDGGKMHDNATELTLTLKRKSSAKDAEEETVNVTPSWEGSTYKFSNLDQYDANGYEYTYSVAETQVEGYAAPEQDGFNITNRITGTTDITGTKTWVDGGKTHDNAKEITLTLTRISAKSGATSEILTATPNWVGNTYTFSNLPKYDAEGYEYTYSVSETGKPAGYESAKDGNNFTNTLTGKTEITGTKTWVDGGKTHDNAKEVTLTLTRKSSAEDTEDETVNVTPTWEGNTYKFSGLDQYDAEGYEYTYTVTETQVDGYAAPEQDGFNITNRITGTTDITGTKTWVDGGKTHDNAKEVTLTLNRKSSAKDAEEETVNVTPTWEGGTYTFSGLDQYDADGYEYTYTVTEKQVEGYAAPEQDGFNITNHIAGTVDITGTKTWVDGGKPHDNAKEIKLTLTRKSSAEDAEEETVDVTPTWEGSTYKFSDLDQYDVNGYEYTYFVTETQVTGYTAPKQDQYDFTNEITSVKISKVDVTNDKEVAGAHIQIIEKDASGDEHVVTEWDSMENGETGGHVVESLETGKTYILREETAPQGYAISADTTFTLNEDGAIDAEGTTTHSGTGDLAGVLLVEDAPLHFTVSKADLTTQKEIADAELSVYKKSDVNEDGTVKDGAKAVDTWTSTVSEDGTASSHDFGSKLTAGEEYVLIEDLAPTGYAYAENTEFKVAEDGTVTVTRTDSNNEVKKDKDGNIIGVLVNDAPISFSVSKADLTTQKEIAGAELSVYKKSDLNEDGTVKDGAKAVDTWTSTVSEDGTASSHDFGSKLTAGEEYVLIEDLAPTGYAYAENTEFKVAEDGTVTVTKTDSNNEVKKDKDGNVIGVLVNDAPITFTVSKADLTTQKEIAGAELSVYKKSDVNEDGTVKDGAKAVDTWTSTVSADGTASSHDFGSKLTAGEAYVLIEDLASTGYAYAENTEFKVAEDGTVTVTKTDSNNEVKKDKDGNVIGVLVNDAPITFTVSKADLTTQKEIAGAELSVYKKSDVNEDGTVKDGAKAIDTWTSTVSADGTASSHDFGSKLTAGEEYVLIEDLAPTGYAYAENTEFKVAEDGTVTVTKTDSNNEVKKDKDGNVIGVLVNDAPLEDISGNTGGETEGKKDETEKKDDKKSEDKKSDGNHRSSDTHSQSDSVRTGDETPILLWVNLFAIAFVMGGGSLLVLKKRRRE